jgi:hypothetical protein
MTNLTLESLAERVRRLERQNRLLRAAVLLVVTVFAAVVCMGQVDTPKELEAERLILRDEAGKARVMLGMTEGGATLELSDAEGWLRLSLGVFEDRRPVLTMLDPEYKERATLGVTEAGPRLELCDAEGESRAGLRVAGDNSVLEMYDARDALRASLGLTDDGLGLRLADEKGMLQAGLIVTDDDPGTDDEPGLVLCDAEDGIRAVVGVSKNGPNLLMYDAEGKARVELTVEGNVPALTMRDAKGERVFSAP